MGIANRIINILVLVAALVVVIFGYMLFDKREKLVKGWETMAKAIASTAKTIDDGSNSGTELAKSLTVQNLNHKKYETLEKSVAKLDAETKRLVAQRNALAETLKDTAEKLEVADAEDTAKLKNVEDSTERQTAILERVKLVQDRNTGVMEEIVKLSTTIEEPITVEDLKNNEKYKESVAKLSRKATDIADKSNKLASHIKKVTNVLEIANPSLDGADYDANLKNTLANIETYRDNFQQSKKDLEHEKSVSTDLKSQLEKKDSEITKHLASIKKQKTEITRLEKIINPSGDKVATQDLVKPISDTEIMKAIRGKIVYVDEKYGFVTIDIGADNEITKKIGIMENKIKAPVAVNEVMTIARGLDSTNPKFSGKIKLVKVNANNAVGNLLPLPQGEMAPQVGDIVYFSDADIAEAEKAKAGTKVASPSAVAPATPVAEETVEAEVTEESTPEGTTVEEKVEEDDSVFDE